MSEELTRRKLLRGSGTAGVAAGLPVSLTSFGLPTRRSRKRAVVVGSGFGGSVATLRLTEAGIPTALVERGQEWEYEGEDSYPTLSGGLTDLTDSLWLEPGRFVPGNTGMLEQHVGGSIPVGVGAGLGGGSLVYGGVLLQPPRELFEQALPNLDYDEMAREYYPRVLSRVSGGPIPDDILESRNYTSKRTFIDNAEDAGMDVVRSEVGFDWDIIREEVEGERTPYASVGEYVFGCNSGAKNTLDRNYIAEARSTGNVDIHTLHNVVTIRKQPWDDSFEVHCDVIGDDDRVVAKHVIECEYLFMAAGSINTTKLLLKARARGHIPSLNDGIGKEWGTNGDELMARTGISDSTGPVQGGPPSIAAWDFDNPTKPTGWMHSPNSVSPEHTQLQMGMCIPDETSTATYSRLTDRIDFNWSRAENEPSHEALLHSMNEMTEVGGGDVVDLKAAGTWHPLGGAAMGTACSYSGEVFGTDNLFVVDGALIPGSAGVANPSLTIGANAERVMDDVVPKLG